MKSIYIAHPFGGEQENVEKVEKIIKGLLHQHPRLHVLQSATSPCCQHRFFNNYKDITVNENSNNAIDI